MKRLPKDYEPKTRRKPPKYPYDTWVQEAPIRLERGKDFTIQTRSMTWLLDAYRRRSGKTFVITREGESIVITRRKKH